MHARLCPFLHVLRRDGTYPQCVWAGGGKTGQRYFETGPLEMYSLFRESPPRGFCITSPALRCPVYIINLAAALADAFIELPVMTPKYFPRRIAQVQRPESWRKRA